jgi:hypothetical protein
MSDARPTTESPPPGTAPHFAGLAALFGAIYFIQGIAEPSEGLIAQPLRSLLEDRGRTAGEITAFMTWVSLPWALKPLYGLLVDFVPFGRSPRRNWLILMTAATALGLGYVSFDLSTGGSDGRFLAVVVISTVGVAFTDVVTDALMVERGQPWGMTGRLQSVQWAAMYGATVLTGFIGGWISQAGRPQLGFLICAVAAAISTVLAVVWVRQGGRRSDSETLPQRVRLLVSALRNTRFLAAAAFLFLWSFNPFSSAIQDYYMTQELGLSEQFYGNTVSISAGGSVAACIAYGWYCRRVSPDALIHLSILCGMLTTLCYLGLQGRTSAIVIAAISGFTYMTGTIIQLDLAARVCPVEVSGTLFATLMALSNLGLTAAMAWGGHLYDDWANRWGADRAFDALVIVGAATTAGCWVLTPFLLNKPEVERN